MLDIFRGLKGLVKPHSVTIDSSIFRLHYSATVTFLLAFSLIVTTRYKQPTLNYFKLFDYLSINTVTMMTTFICSEIL